ncbi:tetratricopeptide repeat protein [Striga asiatica]|uniref:Tetratricopeptide repeat protein n=1 Tax=Striga asiatica TaxID=4170 RepID=A0A5A7QCS7_STRAF|nr:tetratricopeptide repeat protein [Striga asiatica]
MHSMVNIGDPLLRASSQSGIGTDSGKLSRRFNNSSSNALFPSSGALEFRPILIKKFHCHAQTQQNQLPPQAQLYSHQEAPPFSRYNPPKHATPLTNPPTNRSFDCPPRTPRRSRWAPPRSRWTKLPELSPAIGLKAALIPSYPARCQSHHNRNLCTEPNRARAGDPKGLD